MVPGNKFAVNDDGDKVLADADGTNPNAVGESKARIGMAIIIGAVSGHGRVTRFFGGATYLFL